MPEFSIQDMLASIKHGVSHGAAMIYANVLAIEQDVTKWVADHPDLKPLIDVGVELASQAIRRTGLSTDAISIVADDIVGGLRYMAALDNSVVGTQAVVDLLDARGGPPPEPQAPEPQAPEPQAPDPKAADTPTGKKGKAS